MFLLNLIFDIALCLIVLKSIGPLMKTMIDATGKLVEGLNKIVRTIFGLDKPEEKEKKTEVETKVDGKEVKSEIKD